MRNNTPTTENPHIENPFDRLSKTQWRFITAMAEDRNRTKKEAAKHIGIAPDTVYRWPDFVDDALSLTLDDIHSAALQARKQVVLKAIQVKEALLDSDDEAIRSKVASEFIEWELGKAKQISELTGKDDGPIKGYVSISPEAWDDDSQ